jgi:hypothetical protein
MLNDGTSGSRVGYKPYVMTSYMTDRNPLTEKNNFRSAVAVAEFQTRIGYADAVDTARESALPAAKKLLDSVAASSSFIEERDRRLSVALEALKPGASERVPLRAQSLLQQGFALTNEDALQQAIAAEMTPLGSLGDSVTDWFARQTSGGGRAVNTFVDWQCSPANTAIGAFITGIWTGPAGASAAARGATQIQQMAGCDDWNRAYSLARQLGVSRERALELMRSGAYVQDSTGTWVSAASVSGIWNTVKPLLPFAALAAVAFMVLK